MASKQVEYIVDLTLALTQKELKAKYKSTSLGFLWMLINPVLHMLVLTTVFSFFLRFNLSDYPLFVFSGLLPWMYFSFSVQAGTSSLISNRDIIKKVNFPRELLPLSSVLAHLYIFIIACLLLIMWSIMSNGFSILYLALFPLVLIQTLLHIGLSFLLSSFDIYYRDISFGLQALLLPLFYMTPIFYPLSFVPEKFQMFYILNPIVGIITTYQAIFVDPLYFNSISFTLTLTLSVLIFIAGYLIFKKRSLYFAEWV